MKKIGFHIGIILLLFSCAKDLKKETTLHDQPDLKAELHQFFKTNFNRLDSAQRVNDIALKHTEHINRFYQQTDHQLLWIDDSLHMNETAQKVLNILSKADEYGLSASMYGVPLLYELKRQLPGIEDRDERYRLASEIELLLTNWYLLFTKHLNYGVLDSLDSITLLPRKQFTINLSKHLLEGHQKNNLIGGLLSVQPKHQAYKKLQLQLKERVSQNNLSTERILVKNFRVDSINAIKQAQKALVLHRYLDSISTDTIFVEALKKFQGDHGLNADGLVGKNTAKALSKSPYEYYQTLVVNLERWRWKEAFPEDYLLINIPAYDLRMFVGGQYQFKHKTVVGKFASQTPELRDSLKTIIAYPYWYVPKKISLEEILVKAQEDSAYFSRNNFEVITYQKDSVNYDSLDWNEINKGNFNYLVRQGGGYLNSLGLVKFIFPNKHAIYLHDTPAMHLFGKEKRAFSHGCVRVQGSLKLANYLLDFDDNEMTIDSVRKYIKLKKEKPIKMNRRLAIYMYYMTAVVDENDRLILYPDIYQKDKLILEQMYATLEKNKVLLPRKKGANESLD